MPAAGHDILRSQLNIYTSQITSELVRLIVLIGLNTFSTHNVSKNSLKNILRTRFEGPFSRKRLKLPYLAIRKGFSKLNPLPMAEYGHSSILVEDGLSKFSP